MVELKLDFLPSLKKLEDLTKKPWMTSWLSGGYQSLFKGSGIEFDNFSVYTPEQDSRKIDWKASSKSEKVLVRNYVEERDLKVMLLMDSSNNMLFSSTEVLKCEYAAELTNSLAFAVVESNDQVSLMMASKDKLKKIPFGSGKKNYFKIITELQTGDNYGSPRDILTSLTNLFKSDDSGLLFIISDFINASDEELEAISLLHQKFDIFVFMVRDRMERFLPKDVNAVVFENMDTGKSIIVNLPEVRSEYINHMKKDEARIESFFLKHDIRFQKFYTHQPYRAKLFQFFEGIGK